jgi:hypothetical protein
MRRYCKAYQLKDFRQFRGWSEQPAENEEPLSDDDIGYLWDDFTTVRSPVGDGRIIFGAVTPEWQNFCKTVLKFEIPEDIRYAYEQPDRPEDT